MLISFYFLFSIKILYVTMYNMLRKISNAKLVLKYDLTPKEICHDYDLKPKLHLNPSLISN